MKIGLSGTPGTGKTTIAKIIEKDAFLVHIEVSHLAIEKGWIKKEDSARDTKIVDLKEVRKYIDSLDNIIIDSHYAHEFDCDIIFVLRCPPKILYKRLKERSYGKDKIRENMLAEIVDSCLINAVSKKGEENTFEILNMDKESAAKEILDILRERNVKKSVKFKKTVRFLTEENLRLVNRVS
ncbi:MAG: adenylate kinase family protein [Candidatus Methanofastidiosia archaeon]